MTTRRSYSKNEDLEQMIALLRRVKPLMRADQYPSPADLRELLQIPPVIANTRLWFDARRRLVAFALVDTSNNLLFELEPHFTDPGLSDQIINWGVECLQRAQEKTEEKITLDASCSEDDRERIAILERHGFVEQPVRSYLLSRDLADLIPEPFLPAGFTIRPSKGLAEIEEWVQLHRAAFGTENMTIDERSAMLSGADYDPQLDLTAVAPDGSLAAYCLCQIHPDENRLSGRKEGWTDPIATHPAYQRRGLARALLLTGLRLLKGCGVDSARMGTSSENIRMQSAARQVGFQIEASKIWFSKPIRYYRKR